MSRKKVIVKKKKLKFKKAFQIFIDQTTSLWRLTRWAKKKNHKSKKISKISDLIQKKLDETIIRTTIEFENKIDMLFIQFFSNTKHANLRDTLKYRYLNVVIKTHENIIEEKILQTIKKCKLDNVSRSNDISNKILKLLINKLMSTLLRLFRVCATLNYHFRCFRKAHIIALKKSNKSNYTNLKAYKFIALLNTLSKTFELIIVKRINNLTETHKLLFNTQMNERREKTCKTTLKLLTKQIHIVWNMSKNKVATLLSLDVAEAYDHVSREKLIHNLRKKRISEWIIAWINCFMQNKHITLIIDEQATFMNRVSVNISQDSFISFILYLFYNANILEIFETSRYKITIINFVNDINILIYDTSTTNNCRVLEQTHIVCEQWMSRHDACFASIKYELLHLARNHKRFDMTIIININDIIKRSSITVRILRVQIDIKLKWESHMRKIQKKKII
jgi:predicted RNA binding protein with dsRBD fold (UPF0201 family)